MTMFLVKKGDTRIRKVEVLSATPRWVILPCNVGRQHRRERIVSMYHSYHKTFAMAKHWLLTEFEIEARRALQAYEYARKLCVKVEWLTEKDL